jgi:DNA-binding MarR family transcriptional regulator
MRLKDGRPTKPQLEVLETLDSAIVEARGAEGYATHFYHYVNGVEVRFSTRVVESLIKYGWVSYTPDPDNLDFYKVQLTLTRKGRDILRREREYTDYEAIPAEHLPRARVTKRPLGGSAIKGMPGPGMGRNVDCWTCYENAKAKHQAGLTRTQPSPVVWFINESGQKAQREAERALRLHCVWHFRQERSSGSS